METRKKAWINLLFLAVTLLINALGALGVINGLSQKEISDMFVTLITPSPSTFSIWSVIYSLLIIALVVMILKKDDLYYTNAVRQITLLFRISCILNAAWIVAFSFVQMELSVLLIFGFVIVLSLICRKLLKLNGGKHWLLPLTFGVYAGWLFIASVVNTAAMLVKWNWDGFGIADDIWAILTLAVAVLLVLAVLLKIRNAAFPLPIAWAYFGIYQFLSAPEGFKGEFVLLQTAALVGMAVLIGAAAIQFYRNRWSLIPKGENEEMKKNQKEEKGNMNCMEDYFDLQGDVLIPMNDGTVKAISEICIGDSVQDKDGNVCKVAEVLTESREIEKRKVKFYNLVLEKR